MPLSTTQEDVLDKILAQISDDVPWCIIGSTDSVLRGLDDDPSDIDILATEAAAKQFREVFFDGFIETREVESSQIDTFVVRGEEVEVIFNCSSKSHQKPLINLEEVRFERGNKQDVPLLPLENLISVYEQINKHETAERLKDEFEASNL